MNNLIAIFNEENIKKYHEKAVALFREEDKEKKEDVTDTIKNLEKDDK